MATHVGGHLCTLKFMLLTHIKNHLLLTGGSIIYVVPTITGDASIFIFIKHEVVLAGIIGPNVLNTFIHLALVVQLL